MHARLAVIVALAAPVGLAPEAVLADPLDSDLAMAGTDLGLNLAGAATVPLVMQPTGEPGFRVILDLLPLGALAADLDNFTVSGPGVTEIFDSSTTGVVTMSLGVGIDTPKVSWDLEIGGGVMYNVAFTAGIFVLDFVPRFKLGENVTLGPHVGMMQVFSPSWEGSLTSVDLSGATGLMVGGALTAGNENIAFSMMIDYLFGAEIDVTPEPGFTAPSEIDLEGFMIRMGVILRF